MKILVVVAILVLCSTCGSYGMRRQQGSHELSQKKGTPAKVKLLPQHLQKIVGDDTCDHDCEYREIDCEWYYSCVNGRKEYHECRWDEGLAFNPILKTCDWIENVPHCLHPTQPPKCDCEYRPDVNDCTKYFYCPNTCNEELCERRSCPDGMAWSIDADFEGHQQCTNANIAVCAK